MTKGISRAIQAEIKEFLSDSDLTNDEITDFLGEKDLNQGQIDEYIVEYRKDNPEKASNDLPVPKFLEGYQPLTDDVEIEDLIKSKLSGISRGDIGSIKILAEIYDKENKKWESLGSAIENLSFDDLDSDKTVIKDMLGNAYGPGWYKCKVWAVGKIRTAFSVELSARKYKDPRAKEGAVTAGGMDPLIAVMLENSKIDAARAREQAAEASKQLHELMMKMFENKKQDVNPIDYLKIGMDMNRKDTSNETLMREVFGLVKSGMTIQQDAKEAKDGQDLIGRIGESVIDKIPDILANLSKGKGQGLPAGQPAAQIEGKQSDVPAAAAGSPGSANINDKVTDINKVDPVIIQNAVRLGAFVALLDSMYLGMDNNDPIEPFSEQITVSLMYKDMVDDIMKETDDMIIGRLCTLSPHILEYFKDEKYKKYVISIFEDVRNDLTEKPVEKVPDDKADVKNEIKEV